jgi:hypothetical protein
MKTECMHCNKEFDAVRDSAIYCSNSCRTSAYKQRNKDKLASAVLAKQRILEQERLQLIADEKQLKQEQKTELQRQEKEKRDEIAMKEKETKRLQDEQDEADFAELNRKQEEERMQKEKNDQLMKAQKALHDSIKAKQKRDREMEEFETRSKYRIAGFLLGAASIYKLGEVILTALKPDNLLLPDEIIRPVNE